jgi:ElaB/YqjD/DUF883 family membrane-anchored ribosome-binding protein
MDEIMHHNDGEKNRDNHRSDAERHPDDLEAYREGSDVIFENEDGDVVDVEKSPASEKRQHEFQKGREEVKKAESEVEKVASAPGKETASGYKNMKKRIGKHMQRDKDVVRDEDAKEKKEKADDKARKRGPAMAYQIGNTVSFAHIPLYSFQVLTAHRSLSRMSRVKL